MTMPHGPMSRSRLGERFRSLLNPVRWFRRRLLRKPASTLAIALAAILGGSITLNALALQTERHPAPMFTALVEERPVETASIARSGEAAPAQAERKAETAPRPVQKAVADPARPTAPAGRDQMAELIRTSTANTAPGANPEISQQRAILVQRALNKAGYGPLKEDGAFGAASRQAFERFEADRRLAVRGEPTGRSLRELQRVSGIVID